MVKILNLSNENADCLLLQMSDQDGKYFNMLIDGGLPSDKLYSNLQDRLGNERLNGIVVTHIDNDHIAGILELIKEVNLNLDDTFILFNKYDESMISYKQARQLADYIKEYFHEELLYKSYARCFTDDDNEKINRRRDKKKHLPVNLMSVGQRRKLEKLEEEKVNITVLWPDEKTISCFMRKWSEDKKASKLTNRSSIVLLIEFMDYVILLPGDAYFKDFVQQVEEIGITHIDIIKASHHGARDNNRGLTELAKRYKCQKVIFTIAEKYDGKHPDMGLVKDLIDTGCTLFCRGTPQNEELRKEIESEEEIIGRE